MPDSVIEIISDPATYLLIAILCCVGVGMVASGPSKSTPVPGSDHEDSKGDRVERRAGTSGIDDTDGQGHRRRDNRRT